MLEFEEFNKVWKTGGGSWDALETAEKVASPYARKEVYSQRSDEEARENRADPLRAAFVADCEAFVGQLAERYFRTTRQATLAADPHHLVFGCRFAYLPPTAVLNEAAKYLDVISFNCYSTNPGATIRQYASVGKPLIIGEFSFRGKDSGLPNSKGAGPVVETQEQRAAAFETYVRVALRRPEIVGYHWFQHADQPKEGRFDGENSNYGLVMVDDEPYPLLTRKMLEVSRLAPEWHRSGE